ncbi:MAG: GNAT family N-acetyltransferase [Lachnospiraceae bacterium]
MLIYTCINRELTREEKEHLLYLQRQEKLTIKNMSKASLDEALSGQTKQDDCNKTEPSAVICISDDNDILNLAGSRGVSVVACLDDSYKEPKQAENHFISRYAVDSLCALDREYLETVYFRSKGIPRRITDTDRLIIRELCRADLPALLDIYESNEKTPFFQSFYDNREEAEEYLNHYIENVYDFYGYGIWGICLKNLSVYEEGENIETEEPIIGIMGFTPRENALELGYALQKQYQGRGFVTEAKKALTEYAERVLDCRNIIIVRAD